MKKLLAVLLIVPILFLITSCKKEDKHFLTDYISENRINIYTAQSDYGTLSAELNKSEIPLVKDGIVGDVYTQLVFKIPFTEPEISYELRINIDGVDYNEKFTFDPVTNSLTATIYPESFNKTQFDADICLASNICKVTFTSILTDGIKNTESLLKNLYLSQKTYLDNLTENGVFNGEITIKILPYKDAFYYYVAITDKKLNTKAMLFDAVSGEILATKDIF